ncbi:MAG TPA: 6-carboxytetrahydropterin synthase QueD [Candidatus Avacidaminococcus intestinavium]|uniref:6-carboxy-5,6,7,8-tetrahydropterin synthase n=1 Tax=Candidatus Avacidaminococcus intestinavium TaxID=2840684 RepID=A0A9D1MQY0_9FIRM|nr:6-carboxytetrahydropterin synthase QueD [Candidatus Avacidaminococcus intestinavium]
MILIKEFEFDAAHYLPEYHGKCEKLHGHTYKLVVKVEGKPDHEGMIIDFIKLKELVKENVLIKLDHALINDLLAQPSAENIAVWVWQTLVPLLQAPNYKLFEVEVWETKTSGIVYRGEQDA